MKIPAAFRPASAPLASRKPACLQALIQTAPITLTLSSHVHVCQLRSMHLSLRPLPGPARAPAVGLQGNVCRTKLGLLAMHLLGTAKQGGPPEPNVPGRSPGPASRCFTAARGVGLQDPSSCHTLWLIHPSQASPWEEQRLCSQPSLPRTDGNSWKAPEE